MEGGITYIGSEHIISPLGDSAETNFQMALQGSSGIIEHNNLYGTGQSGFVSCLRNFQTADGFTKLESLIISSANASLLNLNPDALKDRWILILATTKGDVDHLKNHDIRRSAPPYLIDRISNKLKIKPERRLIVSNACISGLHAAILAHDLVDIRQFDHALVIGADLVTEFVYCGFASFLALSKGPCKPYDRDRNGLTLGEGVASMVISQSRDIFPDTPLRFEGGAVSNDANHISAPSRNGEGLHRAIQRCLRAARLSARDINYISAHGTATPYNDEMESIAFSRAGLSGVPVNSLKGYFGHTLGASGILELAMVSQILKNDLLMKSLGYENQGTTEPLNVITQNQHTPVHAALKTSSGFGGCNAAAIIRK